MMTWVHCNEHGIDYVASDGCPECEKIVGKYYGKDIKFWELKMHPEILRDSAYLSIVTLKPIIVTVVHLDWKCKYCGCLRPSTEYKCDICGGPRP